MTLELTHAQRINLVALLGGLPVQVQTIRRYWAVLDKIDLSEEEKQAIGFKEAMGLDRRPIAVWNPAASLPVKEIEFTNWEIEILRSLLRPETEVLVFSRDWLEGLLDQLGSPEPAAQ